MGRRRGEYSGYQVVADAIGLTTLIVGTAAIALGEVTDIFGFMKSDHPGVEFVYKYLCAPIYLVISPLLPTAAVDYSYMVIAAVLVVVATALVYGLVAYLALRLFGSILGVDKDS